MTTAIRTAFLAVGLALTAWVLKPGPGHGPEQQLPVGPSTAIAHGGALRRDGRLPGRHGHRRLLGAQRARIPCQFAFDGECDDPNFGGTGACPVGDRHRRLPPLRPGRTAANGRTTGSATRAAMAVPASARRGPTTADCATAFRRAGVAEQLPVRLRRGMRRAPGSAPASAPPEPIRRDCRGVSAPSDMVYQNPGSDCSAWATIPARRTVRSARTLRRAIMQFQRRSRPAGDRPGELRDAAADAVTAMRRALAMFSATQWPLAPTRMAGLAS